MHTKNAIILQHYNTTTLEHSVQDKLLTTGESNSRGGKRVSARVHGDVCVWGRGAEGGGRGMGGRWEGDENW